MTFRGWDEICDGSKNSGKIWDIRPDELYIYRTELGDVATEEDEQIIDLIWEV